MIEKDTKGWISTGRGGPQSLAKSDKEILGQENETAVEGMEPTGEGAKADDSGAKPVYMTGGSPNHEGRGPGRGR